MGAGIANLPLSLPLYDAPQVLELGKRRMAEAAEEAHRAWEEGRPETETLASEVNSVEPSLQASSIP
jgi:hypothetical protein